MYRFRKENWVRKVDSCYPKNWSKSNGEYGFFMEQPRHTADSQYMETHSDRVLRSPYFATPIPRAHMSVADKAPPRRLRKYRQRVGVYYDYDDGNDMWEVLRHRENPPTGVRRLPRSLSPVARRNTFPSVRGSSDNAQPTLVDNPWSPMIRTTTAVGRSLGRVSHRDGRHGYQTQNGTFRGERAGEFSGAKVNGRPGNATDLSRVNTPEYTRELTLGPRLYTIGPREYHGLSGRAHLSKGSPDGHLGERRGTVTSRGRSLSPMGDRNYSAGTSRYFGDRIGSPTRNRRESLSQRFFRFHFHEPWKSSMQTSSKF